MTLLSVAFCALLAILSVNAQSQPYGQCGGIGWTGSTTCTSGWTCVASNAYYSQCLQGGATTTATTKGTTTTTSAPSSTASPSKINYWFAFGDSYTATGFNINSTKPSTSNPLGNPSTPTNAGGGASYVNYLTTTYNTSQLLTYNFAYNGATVDKSIVAPIQGVTMTDEVNSFMNTVASKPSYAPWTSTDALFSFWIGINDIGSTFNNGNSSSVNAELISAYFGLVQKLYNAGARNFMFINVPAIDRSPQYIGEGTAAAAKIKADVADYNSKLSSAISSFKSANSAANTFMWDSNAEFNTILNNPKSYGFTDATSQGSASGDFWGNVLHPGPAAHKLFAQNIATAVLSGTVW